MNPKPNNVHAALALKYAFAIMAMLVIGLFAGCEGPPPVLKTDLYQVPEDEYPVFTDVMFYDGLAFSLQQSLAYLQRIPAERTFRFGPDKYTAAHIKKSIETFGNFIAAKPSTPELNDFIQTNYRVYRSAGSHQTGEVLFTGYYEPLLQGSLTPTDEYRFPLYARPDDLITIDLSPFSSDLKGKRIMGRIANDTVVPYYDRRQIQQKSWLTPESHIIAWVKDPINLFFLHIQGSGKIALTDGTFINVHYHASNGRPYRSIGKLLIDQGKIAKEEMSMQKIRAYLQEHPDEVDAILNHNPSYVFFKIEPEGPLGYLEVVLTPGRSIALDRRIFAPAALAYIETQMPLVDRKGEIHTWVDFSGFALNHDTGGAIRGPGRVDVFWGSGTYARITAGHMQHNGALYFLVLKPEAVVDISLSKEQGLDRDP
jgi:membrane-bound lytic murein transglycosylase A